MSLHQFMTEHRDEILVRCVHKLKQDSPERNGENLEEDLPLFFDEVVSALKYDAGFTEACSSLPERSDIAARVGERRHRAGYRVTKVPLVFAALSNSIGTVGQRYGLNLNAREYEVFNQCIDTGVATSIENYWRRESEEQRRRASEQIGFLAHELRNALGSAALAFKLLRRGDVGLNGRTAEVLSRSLVRMETLVAKTLGAVQLEAGVAPELRPIRVASILRDLEASAVPERGVTIRLQLDESLVLDADEVLLTSAVSNILQNALKFTRTGGHVTLRARGEADWVVIEVEDECGGLPCGEHEQLFAPFVKRSRDPRSVGLGLAITRQAVLAQHGEIHVRDHPGEGCMFVMKFARAHEGAPAGPP
jgi:signal transduction histidine kinase